MFDSNEYLITSIKYLFQEVNNNSEVQTRRFLSDPPSDAKLLDILNNNLSVLWACSSKMSLARDKQ